MTDVRPGLIRCYSLETIDRINAISANFASDEPLFTPCPIPYGQATEVVSDEDMTRLADSNPTAYGQVIDVLSSSANTKLPCRVDSCFFSDIANLLMSPYGMMKYVEDVPSDDTDTLLLSFDTQNKRVIPSALAMILSRSNVTRNSFIDHLRVAWFPNDLPVGFKWKLAHGLRKAIKTGGPIVLEPISQATLD